jgi:hypothetical protein
MAIDDTHEQQHAQQEKIGFGEFREVEPYLEATEKCVGRRHCDECDTESTDENLDVQFGDQKLMDDTCAVCGTATCNANNPDNVAYFGVCPMCHQTDGYICVGDDESDKEIGRVAVLLCRVHKTCWSAGYKTFSSWRGETVEQQKALQAELGFWSNYSLVEPVYCSSEAIEESSRCVSVHRITAKDLDVPTIL